MKEEILKLQSLLKKNKINAYLVPTSDFHGSEYLSDYFKEREYLSGFTGSAGTLIVTQETAYLWTDGRYFLQAEKELADSGITLCKLGEEGVLTVDEFLKTTLKKGDTLAFDGKLISAFKVLNWEKNLNVKLLNKNFTDFIWQDRPPLPEQPIYFLDEKYCGEQTTSKLQKIRKDMKKSNCNGHLISSLEDIAWILNLRGNDILNTPVALAYLYLSENNGTLFISEKVLTDDITKKLAENNITVSPYQNIYKEICKLSKHKKVLLDLNSVNYSLYKSISGKTVDNRNPSTILKAIKNPTEIQNLKNCHIKDGVAVTEFMIWLKDNVGKTEITEISAADYLENCRKKQDGFISLSFDTISAYQQNGAMVHYSAAKESNATIKASGMLLVDSGGQYFDGTTDITRTFILGAISNEAKLHYTTVLRSMLSLASAKFLYGATGSNLDILAREPLWQLSLDYKHGTGHGVGYLLSVHEGPNAFSKNSNTVFQEGMVTTDEPGIYLENKYGIRIENELLCCKDIKNEYGQFMRFETLTLAPIDVDGIDTSYMTEFEISALNSYHELVFKKLSPFFNGENLEKLRKYTSPIKK